jgi:hypothetical protein
MMHTKSESEITLAASESEITSLAVSESEITSVAASSPPRPRIHYYLRSPPRDSARDGRTSSMEANPVCNIPSESPSHPSSVSRFSGIVRDGGGRKAHDIKALNGKGWPECGVIIKEGGSCQGLSSVGGDSTISLPCKIVLGFLCCVLLFTFFCLVYWGARRVYVPHLIVKVCIYTSICLQPAFPPTYSMRYPYGDSS